MVVVAIIGIVAAIGVPNLVKLVHKNRLTSAADEVSSFLDGARRHAFAVGRCTRVFVASAQKLTLQTRTSGDCAVLDDTQWVDTENLIVDNSTITLASAALSTTSAPPAHFHIVFRPNGRLVGNNNLNVSTTDDGARIAVTDTNVAGDAYEIRVTNNGRICSNHAPNPVPAMAVPWTCP